MNKQEYAFLTDNDLMYAKGQEEEMYGKLQIKLGKTQDQRRIARHNQGANKPFYLARNINYKKLLK